MSLDNPLLWWHLLIILGLLSFILFLEFRYRAGRFRLLRLIFSITALLVLVAIYLEPTWEQEAPKQKMAIITSHVPDRITNQLPNDEYRLLDFQEFLSVSERININDLKVVGEGLEGWELSKLNQPFTYQPFSNEKEGLIDFDVSHMAENAVGELQLKYNLDFAATIQVSGPGLNAISVEASPNDSILELEVSPLVSGDLAWNIEGIRGSDTLFSEILPVSVSRSVERNVLMLSGTPSFEMRFLKNYLATVGFGIAERQKISSDVYFQAFTALEEFPLTYVSSDLLSNFSLIVLENRAYEALSRTEKKALSNAVKQGDLGVIWMDDEKPSGWFTTRDLVSEEVTLANESDVKLQASVLGISRGVSILYGVDEIGGFLKEGIGSVLLPRFLDTYKLSLAGEKDVYQGIWNKLLNQVLPADRTKRSLRAPKFIWLNEPVELSLKFDDFPEQVRVGEVRVAVRQHWYKPDDLSFDFWPVKSGWNRIEIDDSDDSEVASFYVFESDDWRMRKVMDLRESNLLHGRLSSNQTVELRYQKQYLSWWLLLSIFLVCMGVLWLEQRLN